MKNLIVILAVFIACTHFGCASVDGLFEEETMVDAKTGEISNKKEVSQKDYDQNKISQNYNKILADADVITDSSFVGFLMNNEKKLLVIAKNPHPRETQTVVVLDCNNNEVGGGEILPNDTKDIYLYPGTYTFRWTISGITTDVKKTVDKTPAARWVETKLGTKLCHQYSLGHGQKRNF